MVIRTLRQEGQLISRNNAYVNYSTSVLISIGLGLTVLALCQARIPAARVAAAVLIGTAQG